MLTYLLLVKKLLLTDLCATKLIIAYFLMSLKVLFLMFVVYAQYLLKRLASVSFGTVTNLH